MGIYLEHSCSVAPKYKKVPDKNGETSCFVFYTYTETIYVLIVHAGQTNEYDTPFSADFTTNSPIRWLYMWIRAAINTLMLASHMPEMGTHLYTWVDWGNCVLSILLKDTKVPDSWWGSNPLP